VKGRFRPDPCLSHVASWIACSGQALLPDRQEAERFLLQLDAEADFFSFRTFSDTPYTRLRGSDPLEQDLHGSLEACWPELVRLNRAGAAVAVTINETDGRGRGVEHIRRVRALFLDDDRGGPPGRFDVPPHFLVMTSQGHCHLYWRVESVEPARFGDYQHRLASRYGGDSRVFALNQAMQIPGFWRRKQATRPHQSRLGQVGGGAALARSQLRRLLGVGAGG